MTDDFYISPPSYQNLIVKIKNLKKAYPFIKVFRVCKSVLGRKIYAIGIGNLSCANLFVGAVHASEWLTCSVLMKFCEQLSLDIKSQKTKHTTSLADVLKNKGIIIIPMLNPDGVEIALNGASTAKHKESFVKNISAKHNLLWQANANGIDLNHNFDAGFDLCKEEEIKRGFTEPMPRMYGGKTPHSEPESKGLVNLCLSFNIKNAFAFHSQGEEIFYEYGINTPSQSFPIASLLSSYSGYLICKQTGTASHAGFKDWFIEKLKRPAFTIELGKGENPLPISQLDKIYEKVEEMLFISLFV